MQAILWHLRQEVIDFEKSKTVLYGQWGFGGRTAFSGGQPETCQMICSCLDAPQVLVAQENSRTRNETSINGKNCGLTCFDQHW